MTRVWVLVAAIVMLGYLGYRGFGDANLSADAAKKIVLRDLGSNSAFRQNPAFDPTTLQVGMITAVEATHSEDGPVPPRWQAEVLVPEGKLFATYEINRTSGKVRSLDIAPLGDDILNPRLTVLVAEEPGTAGGGGTRHIPDPSGVSFCSARIAD